MIRLSENVNKKDLEYFVQSYKEKSIHQAAKSLFISPQGLSRIIRNLEEELDTILFLRSKNGIAPTKSGDFLYKKSVHMIREFSEIQTGIKKLENKKEKLMIACSFGVMSALSVELLFDFMEYNLDIQLHWKECTDRELEKMISSGRADIGICVGKSDEYHFTQKYLLSHKVVLMVYEGHHLYNEKEITFDMLRDEDIVIAGKEFKIYHHFVEKCKESGFVPNIVAETSEMSFAHKLCKFKKGLALAIDFVIDDLQMESIKAIPFADTDFSWDIYFLYNKNAVISSAGKKFEEYIEKRI